MISRTALAAQAALVGLAGAALNALAFLAGWRLAALLDRSVAEVVFR